MYSKFRDVKYEEKLGLMVIVENLQTIRKYKLDNKSTS